MTGSMDIYGSSVARKTEMRMLLRLEFDVIPQKSATTTDESRFVHRLNFSELQSRIGDKPLIFLGTNYSEFEWFVHNTGLRL